MRSKELERPGLKTTGSGAVMVAMGVGLTAGSPGGGPGGVGGKMIFGRTGVGGIPVSKIGFLVIPDKDITTIHGRGENSAQLGGAGPMMAVG